MKVTWCLPSSTICSRSWWSLEPQGHEVIARSKDALDRYTVSGIKTTIPYHRLILRNADFNAGNYNIEFIKDHPPQEMLSHTEFSLFESYGQ